MALFLLALLPASWQAELPAVGNDKLPLTTKEDATPQSPTTPHSVWIVIGITILLALVGTLVYSAICPRNSCILRLRPSFFFWLGIFYLVVLLLMAMLYISNSWGIQGPFEYLDAHILPVAVPWFGALGAVVISLQGVFDHNNQWDSKYNYWHTGRPLFGAVVGMVSYFLLILTLNASGTPSADIASTTNNRIIYFVLAFLVGYREETFRELLKRATDLILQPGGTGTAAPSVVFKVNGATASEIDCGATDAATASRTVVVEVFNAGTAPLMTPSVDVRSTAPAGANVFHVGQDQVTGNPPLAPGASRKVEVVFAPTAPGAFSGTLTVTATNLTSATTIPLSGTRTA